MGRSDDQGAGRCEHYKNITRSATSIYHILASRAQGISLPARVKGFDLVKGFGFAKIFGSSEEVFIHIVLRSFGLAHLETGEAVALRVIEGQRGLMAAEVAGWEQGLVEATSLRP